MCGIVGAISNKKNSVTHLVLDGIKNLQYRGYDSCGCIFISNDKFICEKSLGKVKNLHEVIDADNLHSNIGMGHTRWATHGGVNLTNAHPHHSDGTAIAHNGIIENAAALKEYLELNGQTFTTQTDTEVILRLINLYISSGMPMVDALHRVVDELEGSFAVVVMLESQPETLYVIKRGASLVFAQDDGLSVVASDVNLISSEKFICFEDNDVGIVSSEGITIYNRGTQVRRELHKLEKCNIDVKYNDEHTFMLQEILQQPDIATNILQNFDFEKVRKNIEFSKFSCVNIVGCGSSYFAGCVAKHWIEKYLNVRVNVVIASEFTYRKFGKRELFIFISQSGETADTLSALKSVKSGMSPEDYIVSLVNAPGSTIARKSDFAINTNAGREISVAATKTFTSQIVTLLCIILTQLKNPHYFFDELSSIKNKISTVINHCVDSVIVDELYNASNALFIGKGLGYTLAKEGALKLKEIAYIHAESLPSGELKHGTIALIDENLPVVVIAPHNELFNKAFSSIQEIHARGGKLIILTDEHGKRKLTDVNAKILTLPETSDLTMPAVYVTALQLLAYQVALKKGNDIDHPRNLAKSVTVE